MHDENNPCHSNSEKTKLEVKTEFQKEIEDKIKLESPHLSSNNISTNPLTKEIKTCPIFSDKQFHLEHKFSHDFKTDSIFPDKEETLILMKKNQIKRKLISSCKPLQKAFKENKKFVQLYKDKLDKNFSYINHFFGGGDNKKKSQNFDNSTKEATEMKLGKSLKIFSLGGSNVNSTTMQFTKGFNFLTEKIDDKAKTDINFHKKETNKYEIYNKIFDNNLEEAEKYNSVRFVALKSSKKTLKPQSKSHMTQKKEDYLELKLFNQINLEKRKTTMNFVANKSLKRGVISESLKMNKLNEQNIDMLSSIVKGFGTIKPKVGLFKQPRRDMHTERLEMINKYQTKIYKLGKSKDKINKINQILKKKKPYLNLLVSNSPKNETTPLSTDVWYATFQDNSEIINLSKINGTNELEFHKKNSRQNLFHITSKKMPFLKYKEDKIPKNNYMYEIEKKKKSEKTNGYGITRRHDENLSVFDKNIFEEWNKENKQKKYVNSKGKDMPLFNPKNILHSKQKDLDDVFTLTSL